MTVMALTCRALSGTDLSHALTFWWRLASGWSSWLITSPSPTVPQDRLGGPVWVRPSLLGLRPRVLHRCFDLGPAEIRVVLQDLVHVHPAGDECRDPVRLDAGVPELPRVIHQAGEIFEGLDVRQGFGRGVIHPHRSRLRRTAPGAAAGDMEKLLERLAIRSVLQDWKLNAEGEKYYGEVEFNFTLKDD